MLGGYPLWQFTTTGSDSTSKDPNPTLTKIMEPSNNRNLQIRGYGNQPRNLTMVLGGMGETKTNISDFALNYFL
jgi:hypothetical protein